MAAATRPAATAARPDRRSTARVLEAMFRVEADLAFDHPPASLPADLDTLIAAARAGLRRLDHAAPGCAS